MECEGKIAVSIVTYHVDADELRQALACLDSDAVSRVTIVDNAREERVEALSRELGAQYIGACNNGYGAGHNIAIRQTLERGERYHLVMNSDLRFDPAALARMAMFMDDNPDIYALHPRIVGKDGADQYTVRMLPTPFDLLTRRFLPSRMCREARDRYLLKHLDHGQMHDVHYMQGSFMLLRADALRIVGGFDERFFMYPEDIDLTRRIAAVGRAVYWPWAIVIHERRGESYKNLRLLWVHMVNMVRYFNKWGWWSDEERKRANADMR